MSWYSGSSIFIVNQNNEIYCWHIAHGILSGLDLVILYLFLVRLYKIILYEQQKNVKPQETHSYAYINNNAYGFSL